MSKRMLDNWSRQTEAETQKNIAVPISRTREIPSHEGSSPVLQKTSGMLKVEQVAYGKVRDEEDTDYSTWWRDDNDEIYGRN